MFVILLKDIAKLTIGVSYARYETSQDDPNSIECELFTLQEFNKALNLPYRLDAERVKTVFIGMQHKEKLLFTEENVLVIHLLTQTALSVPEKYSRLLIPSSFVFVQLNGKVDSHFFEWYFNEHPAIRKQIAMNTQGAVVSTLSIATLRELEIHLPLLETQQKLGRIYQLQQRKNDLYEEKKELETNYVNQIILNQMEEQK